MGCIGSSLTNVCFLNFSCLLAGKNLHFGFLEKEVLLCLLFLCLWGGGRGLGGVGGMLGLLGLLGLLIGRIGSIVFFVSRFFWVQNV